MAQPTTRRVQTSRTATRKSQPWPFDINLPLAGAPGIECRSGGASNDHQVVFTFAGSVTFNSAAVTEGSGTVGSTSGNGTTTLTVNLTGVSDAQTVAVKLLGVSDGTATADVDVEMGMVLGDTTGNGSVTASDISETKAQSGQAVNAQNFRTDVNANGAINAGDIGLVKSKSGTGLP